MSSAKSKVDKSIKPFSGKRKSDEPDPSSDKDDDAQTLLTKKASTTEVAQSQISASVPATKSSSRGRKPLQSFYS